jgi:hypothetical protein
MYPIDERREEILELKKVCLQEAYKFLIDQKQIIDDINQSLVSNIQRLNQVQATRRLNKAEAYELNNNIEMLSSNNAKLNNYYARIIRSNKVSGETSIFRMNTDKNDEYVLNEFEFKDMTYPLAKSFVSARKGLEDILLDVALQKMIHTFCMLGLNARRLFGAAIIILVVAIVTKSIAALYIGLIAGFIGGYSLYLLTTVDKKQLASNFLNYSSKEDAPSANDALISDEIARYPNEVSMIPNVSPEIAIATQCTTNEHGRPDAFFTQPSLVISAVEYAPEHYRYR